MIRINKPLARKMFYSGHNIIVVPCKCGVDNEIAKAEVSMFCGGEDDPLTLTLRFDSFVRDFEFYNCNFLIISLHLHQTYQIKHELLLCFLHLLIIF